MFIHKYKDKQNQLKKKKETKTKKRSELSILIIESPVLQSTAYAKK